ncbi:ribonuclease HII [Paenarthrobacter sp. DKR-5]|nr:ribonuclease HII [Paenarthrobacter sp. DKR-5]
MKFEQSLLGFGHRYVVGCDEVGRGALAGPVSVGMVLVDVAEQRGLRNVRDSKLLTRAEREALVPSIRRWALASAVGHATAREIDTVGLIAALRLAGLRAWEQIAVAGLLPHAVLLDGNHNWLAAQLQASLFDDESAADPAGIAFEAPVYTKIKADLQCLSVAAASVLAKVERDNLMIELDAAHPQFGWCENKGYATAAHREAIRVGGPSPYHRVSWRLTGPELDADDAAPGGDDALEEELAAPGAGPLPQVG